MGSNAQDFDLRLQRYSKRIDKHMEQLHRGVMLEALKGVVQMTPVDTGRAKGNWQVSIGAPAAGTSERTFPGSGVRQLNDPAATAALGAGMAVVAEIAPYSASFITNNLPYIERLENGSSQQARNPNGMLRITANRLRAWLERKR